VLKLVERVKTAWVALCHPEFFSIVDPNTGAFGRNFFYNLAEKEVTRVSREVLRGTHKLIKVNGNGSSIRLQSLVSLSVIFIDLDGLKKVNDGEGHGAGDKYLKKFADAVLSHIRPYDIFGRWGGDEFVIILPGADSLHAEKVLGRISSLFPGFSWGIAQWKEGNDLDSLIRNADEQMYRQKEQKKESKEGKN
jgi:diguanylate cyclase (GGDEF)-like protein